MHPAAADTTTGLAANAAATAAAADMAAGTVGATKTTTKAEMQKRRASESKLLNARLLLHHSAVSIPAAVLTLHMNAPIINVVLQEKRKAGFL